MARGKELEAIIAIAGRVDPSLQKSIKQATSHTQGLESALKVAGAVGVASLGAVVAASAGAVSAAAEYEQAFAKTQTLLSDTTNMEQYSKDIINLSNETGVAATELTDTIYNAISAGVDQADAVEFAGTAAKLAAAGFTDSGSALSVLTTAMNAYGDAAGTAEQISDSLLTVQNLGVTTVAELSASMGKAIATGSAYGVDLSNIESAYISLTKQGINTAEGTTYMASMMKELGDAGSTVGGIITEQTGKSFSELMADGKSLADIISILNDSVDGDANALMNLWSSAEAGKASNAILNNGLETFNSNLNEITNSAGLTDTAYGTVTNTLEHQKEVIANLGHNFMITAGEQILPYVSDFLNWALPGITTGMEALGPILGSVGDVATSVIDGVKGVVDKAKEGIEFVQEHETMFQVLAVLIGGLAVAIVAYNVAANGASIAMGVLNGIIAVQTAVSGAATVATTALGAAMAFLTSPITLIILAIAGLIAVGVLLYKNWDTIALKAGELWGTVVGFFSGIGEFIGGAFAGAVGAAKAQINSIISLVNGAINAINNLGITIPDWVPLLGGKSFQLAIPNIPMLATGGFTNGVSIAGEAGTEAVISFDRAYRDQNISYWAKAGKLLGVTDGDLFGMAGSSNGGTTEYNLGGISFSPNVTIKGNASKQDVVEGIRASFEEFTDLLDEYFEGKDRGAYGPSY